MTLSKNIRYLRKKYDWSQDYVAEKLGYKSFTTIQKWETGVAEPPIKKLRELAQLFNVDIELLANSDLTAPSPKTLSVVSNSTRIKVYGSVPAGIPLEAIEDIVDWEDIPLDWSVGGNEFIGLRVKGDSMAPKYVEGDTVIVKIQPDCESGQDAVVYVNGYEATLKKLIKKTDCLILQPLNPSYEPKVYDYNDEDNPIKILGVVVELRRRI